MKIATSILSVMILLGASSGLKAQCGCSTMQHATTVYRPSGVSALPSHRPTLTPASIAYVNELVTPIQRANYTLKYAVHLTNGRVLLSDFLPSGFTPRGLESHNGSGSRRMNASSLPNGGISVVDPVSNRTVAVIRSR